MDEMKIIHANVFQPHNSIFKVKGSKNNYAEAQWVECTGYNRCGLLIKGMCARTGVFSSACPYGKYIIIGGPSQRSSKYYSWVKEQKERFDGIVFRESPPVNYMASVGDYIFLSYSFIAMCEEVPFLSKGGFFSNGSPFLLNEHFTVDNIKKLVHFRPQAMMGGEIKDYQKEVIPKFLKHLSEQFPEFYKQLIETDEYSKQRSRELTNIGRSAILQTLTPNIGLFKDIHGGLWTWDGIKLTSTNSKASFLLVDKFSELSIVPSEKSKVKITDECQVNDKTEFMD